MEKPNWAPAPSCSNTTWMPRRWGHGEKAYTRSPASQGQWLPELSRVSPPLNSIPFSLVQLKHQESARWVPGVVRAGQARFWRELRPQHIKGNPVFISFQTLSNSKKTSALSVWHPLSYRHRVSSLWIIKTMDTSSFFISSILVSEV